MNAPRSYPRFFALLGVAALLLGAPGCTTLFVAKHRVLVDSIAAPGVTKPTGQSYRLVSKRSVVSNTPVQVPVIIACVDAALATTGMFPAPANAPSDLFIEVAYGQDSTPRVDPSARETYIQISARSNPDKSLDRATGPELWDVKVAVLGISSRFENALPLLCSVAASYIGTDTHKETRLDIPQNAPAIAQVRETAIKSLDRPDAAGTNLAPAAGPTPGPAPANNPTAQPRK